MNLIADISKLRLQNVIERFTETEKSDYNKLQILVKEVHTNCIRWSSLFNNYCFLYTGHSNGEVCIWKIERIANNITKEINPVLIYCFDTLQHTISCIYSAVTTQNNYYLVTGHNNGIVQCFILTKVEENVSKTNNFHLWSYADNIKVTKVISTPWDQGILFIIIKGQYIVAVVVNESGTVIQTATSMLGNMFITGIQEITPTEFAVATFTGHIVLLDLLKSSSGKLVMNEMKVSCNVDFKSFSLLGIICSKKLCLWGLVLSPNKMYDHLTLKHPSMITFCSCDKFVPMDLLVNNPSQKLNDCWDCLETIRCLTIQNDQPMTEYLKNFDDVSTYELKYLLWICTINDTLFKKLNTRKYNSEYAPALNNLILVRKAIETLAQIINKMKKSRKDVSEFQLKSVHCLKKYLHEYKENHDDKYGTQPIIEILQETHIFPKYEANETCGWCDEELVGLQCSSNHPLNRCMLSMVQIPPAAYLSCPICDRSGHIKLVEDGPVHCVWCDAHLVNANLLLSEIEEDEEESMTKT